MNKNHYDELLDSKIKCAGLEMLAKLAEDAPSEQELEAANTESADLDKKVGAAISKKVAKLRAVRFFKTAGKVAAALLIVAAVSTVAISSSEALRVRFLNLFVTSNEISVDIKVDETVSSNDPISAAYLPEGYTFVDEETNETLSLYTYKNTSGETMRISRFIGEVDISVNNEGSTVREIDINGKASLLVENDKANTLVFYTEMYTYMIEANVESEELVKIARKISN